MVNITPEVPLWNIFRWRDLTQNKYDVSDELDKLLKRLKFSKSNPNSNTKVKG